VHVQHRRVSVARGKRDFTRLLRAARRGRRPVVIVDERKKQMAGALLSPAEFERYLRLRSLYDAIRISQDLRAIDLNALALSRESRRALETRVR
jgi:PHD/YefM family antitoxin component YafN of YafNO toxin-antitoxin module